MYFIMTCPRCGNIQGLEMGNRTVSCRKCGLRTKTETLKMIGPFKDQEEMRARIWDIKSGNMVDNESILSREMLETSKKVMKKGLNLAGKENLILDILSKCPLEKVRILEQAEPYGIEEVELESILDRLIRTNRVFSPRYGLFESVK